MDGEVRRPAEPGATRTGAMMRKSFHVRQRLALRLTEWLREHSRGLPDQRKAGFYGLDVYSMWESIDVVTRYLERVDPQLAERARQSYGCFDPFEEDVQEYAWATQMVPTDCEEEVLNALSE